MSPERFKLLRGFAECIGSFPMTPETASGLITECLGEIERLNTELEFEKSSRFALMQGVLDGASPTSSPLEVSARTRGFTSRTPKGDAYEEGFLYAQEETTP
jgi:hypothetical protein